MVSDASKITNSKKRSAKDDKGENDIAKSQVSSKKIKLVDPQEKINKNVNDDEESSSDKDEDDKNDCNDDPKIASKEEPLDFDRIKEDYKLEEPDRKHLNCWTWVHFKRFKITGIKK